MIPGIDVSHWQHEIDWSEVKRSGVKFAFIKATEFPDKRTTLHVDEMLQYNKEGASANDIYWSAYHFFRTHIDPVIQAKVFCETVGNFNSLPPVLDIEVAGTKGERLNYKVRSFVEEVERITGRKPIIYTSGGFWRGYLCNERRSHADWARNYPLWLAQYTTLWPTAVYPWAGWDFWQYSDKGKLPGIKTNVDMNWFNGSETELVNRFILPAMHEDVVVDSSDEHNFASGVEKVFHGVQLSDSFKGDFQEPTMQHRQMSMEREKPVAQHIKTVTRQNGTQIEEEWIRAYFLQNT